MTERAHPLDSVVEALEAALMIGPHAARAAVVTSATVYAEHNKKREAAEQKVVAALQVARAMRDAEPVVWLSQVQHANGSWMVFRAPRLEREAAEADIAGMFGVFRIAPLYALPLPTEPEGAEHG